MSAATDNLARVHNRVQEFLKSAFQPMGDPAAAGGAMPPGAMPPGAGGDPAAAAGMAPPPGAPPMDPSMDPAAAGGMPPGAMPPGGGSPVPPELEEMLAGLAQGMNDLVTVVEQTKGEIENLKKENQTLTQKQMELEGILNQPAGFPAAMGAPAPAGAEPAAPTAAPAAMAQPAAQPGMM